MTRQILDALAEDQYCLAAVAQQYGLSKATLSRFAGIRWDPRGLPKVPRVPDLWRNIAKVVGSNPDFIEAAKRAGVWQSIEKALECSPQMAV
jgi:hypothetical protein